MAHITITDLSTKRAQTGRRYYAYIYEEKKIVTIENATSFDDAYAQIVASGLYGKSPKVCWRM